MTRALYLGGAGVLSTLGAGMAAQLAALQQPPQPAPRCDLGGEQRWPLHRLPPLPGSWQQRLAQTVQAVVAECGVRAATDTALFIGSSSLDMGFEEESQRAGKPAFTGHLRSLADSVTRALNWPGRVFCFSTACTSSLQALLAARDWLQSGQGEEALVLGVEMDNLFTPAGFASLQLLSATTAQPFGADRDGLVLGQAVAALRLQTRPTRWRLAGATHRVDGSLPTGVVPSTLEAAVREAVQQAGCALSELQLLKPQAAGSPPNDAAEAQALQALFGPGRAPPMLGFKPWLGHCMGASAVLELALLMACVDQAVCPAPLPMSSQPGTAFGLRWLRANELAARAPGPRHLLFHSLGFGGGHGALVLERGCA